MVFPYGSVVRGLSCIEDLSESLEDVRPLQRRCTEKAQEGKRIKEEGAKRTKGDDGGSNGQSREGGDRRQSRIFLGSPPNQLSKWLGGPASSSWGLFATCPELCAAWQGQCRWVMGHPATLEFGVWSIFVFYSPAVCVMTSFPAALFMEVSLSDQLSHCIPCSLKHWLSTQAQFLHVGGTCEGGQGVPRKDRLLSSRL